MASYLLVFYAWLLVLFAAGHFISRVLAHAPNTGFYSTLLRNIFTGYVAVVILHSIIQTGFQTVNLVMLLIAALLCIEVRRTSFEQHTRFTINAREVITVLVASTLLFLIPWLTISNNDSHLGFFYTETDYILYSRIAQSLLNNGHENGFTILNQLDSYYTNPEPYHFFDIWGAATVSKLTTLNVFPNLITIVYPTFYLLAFAGYMVLLKKDNGWAPFAAFLLLFVGGITLSFIDIHPFLQSLSNLSYSLVSPKIYKLSYFYAFLIPAFLVYKSGQTKIAVLICLGLPVANIITLPTVVPALILFLLFLYIRFPQLRKTTLLSLGYTLTISLAIIFFYALNQRQSAGLAGAEISKPLDLLSGILQSMDLRTSRNIILGGALSLILLYFPYVLVIVIGRWRPKWSVLAIFPLAVIAISLLAWAALFLELNSSQLFSNISIVIMNIAAAVFFCTILNGEAGVPPSRFALAIIVFVLGATFILQWTRDLSKVAHLRTATHSEEYLKNAEARIPPHTVVGSVRSPDAMTYPFAKYNAVYTLGDYLLLQGRDCFAVNISDLSTPIDSTSSMTITRSMKAIRDGIFYRYSRLPANQDLSEGELMEKFVDEQHIQFLLIEEGAQLPANLEARISEQIQDSLSGERLVRIGAR